MHYSYDQQQLQQMQQHQQQHQQQQQQQNEQESTSSMAVPEPLRPVHLGSAHYYNFEQQRSAAEAAAAAARGETQFYGQTAREQDQNDRDPEVSIGKVYNTIALTVFIRWICAVILLPVSIAILRENPRRLLKITAIYSIAVAAVHLPFLGIPRLRPKAPDNPRVSWQAWVMLSGSTLTWVPIVGLMSQCYVHHDDYAPGHDSYRRRSYESSDQLWKRLRFRVGYGSAGDSDHITKLLYVSVAAGIAGLLFGLLSVVIASRLGSFDWPQDTIRDLYYRRKPWQEPTIVEV